MMESILQSVNSRVIHLRYEVDGATLAVLAAAAPGIGTMRKSVKLLHRTEFSLNSSVAAGSPIDKIKLNFRTSPVR